jgi:hypothetical protein
MRGGRVKLRHAAGRVKGAASRGVSGLGSWISGHGEFAALFVQGSDDSPHLGRFQFFILTAQEPKPGTPNQSGEKCVIAGDRPLFCRVAQLYAGLLRGTALRSHNSRTFTLSQLRQDYGLTPFFF